MKNLPSTYWELMEGHRLRAAFLICLFAFSGLLEGVALVCLLPIFNSGLSNVSYAQPSFIELFHLAWNPADKPKMLVVSLVCFGFFGVLSALAKTGFEIGSLSLRATIEFSFRKKLTDVLLRMRWPKYVTLKMGEITKAMSQEGYMIGIGTEAAVHFCGLVLTSGCFLVLAFGLSIKMTVITLLFGLVMLVISKRLALKTKKHSLAYAASASSLASATEQYFSNLKFMRSFGLIKYVNKKLLNEQVHAAKEFVQTYIFQLMGRFVYEVLGIVFISLIIAFAFWLIPSAFGRIIVFLAMFYRLAPRLVGLQYNYHLSLSLEPWYSSWREKYEFALQHQEPSPSLIGKVMESFDRLRFANVFFKYEERTILKDVSFELPKGKTLALVGESGGGKTTILDLVTGVVSSGSGVCLLNEMPLETLDIDAWRSKIGVVMQNTPIFHATVLENIAMSDPQPNLIRAEECARMAHAWDFIERLPGKLEAHLGSKGATLSQGECQRLALARALYRKPWLLILDEATSALDAQSESSIVETLKSLRESVTILMVSHRLNTVDFADEILLLSGGEIVERGTYSELISRLSGDFRHLAKLQGIVD